MVNGHLLQSSKSVCSK